ncbi:hypothetical protein EOI86_15595 [Hwanghaeella grinnelliae]|uniref:DUF2946 domain-containing protein n=1 Tax=Hwanghaeella grinnelliae TaxID=2500179 RepID=A0A437QQ30_9PROT|nr:hypothetical protein [Hwanghaeella grinnelliae]RVU36605.1 hypothetical protein EOI86_15595 [Hwanghaeella grinnelliae]
MTARAGHSARRSLAVGLALFGLFFQLLLPIPLSVAAEPGAPNRVLEICAADGIVRVPLPAAASQPFSDTANGEDGRGSYVEACNHCVLHAAHLFLPARGFEETVQPAALGERLPILSSDHNPGTAPRAGFDARGPPAAGPTRANA